MNYFREKKFKIFIDFDGTITTEDVGEKMFLKFGDPDKAREIIGRWLDDVINSVQSWRELCATVHHFDPGKFEDFLSKIEIDPTFKNFVNYCEQNGFDIYILSDGLDYYIERILEREGLSHIPRYSNRLNFGENGELIPQFPHTDEECKKCANCKRNHIIENSSDTDYTVYIGDGNSDVCPAQYCDFIFAKDSLLKFCEESRISFTPFSDFDDVIFHLEKYKQKKRLKKRHQAELKRKEVYMQG
jgi:2,3-diketo-5-methylthio-1-phosphopentane phosphatase